MSIYEKLNRIQCALVAPKDQSAGVGGIRVLYKYRSCEDILEALKQHLLSTKTAITISDELVMLGDRYYIKATATLHDTESEACVSNSAYAREPEKQSGMGESQVTGSASSYARKYALNGLFAIDDSKQDPVLDPDADGFQGVDLPDKGSKKPEGYNVSDQGPKAPQNANLPPREADMNSVRGAIYHCESCGGQVPLATVKYCKENAAKFGGRVLCYTCQNK